MLHNVYTELLQSHECSPSLFLKNVSFWVVLASARPLNRSPQAFWSGRLHTDQFCIFCVLGICQRYPHTHTHTQTNTYTHNHPLQYCHVSIYTYQCRLGPQRPFWKLRFLWFILLFFSAPSGKAQSVNGHIAPKVNFQPSSSHEHAERIKTSLQFAAHAPEKRLNLKFGDFSDELLRWLK